MKPKFSDWYGVKAITGANLREMNAADVVVRAEGKGQRFFMSAWRVVRLDGSPIDMTWWKQVTAWTARICAAIWTARGEAVRLEEWDPTLHRYIPARLIPWPPANDT